MKPSIGLVPTPRLPDQLPERCSPPAAAAAVVDSGGAPAGPAQTTSAACQAKRDRAGYDVVLLIGQSNMSGYGAYIVPGFDTTDPRIQQWGRSRYDRAGGRSAAAPRCAVQCRPHRPGHELRAQPI